MPSPLADAVIAPVTTLHVVDAFTDRPFTGNPAAVWVGPGPADETWMRLVAREMKLSETAFLHPADQGAFALRWFTPAAEVRLCGHATLASALVLWETGVLPAGEPARFQTLSGLLTCTREQDWIAMDLPAARCAPVSPPPGLADALGAEPVFCGGDGTDLLVELRDESAVRDLRPDLRRIAGMPFRGVIATSRADWKNFDFVSRFFAPAVGVDEDPVTGSAHGTLGPYWAEKLGRTHLTAFQASARGGVVKVETRGSRVILRGQAVIVSRVELRHGPGS
ncbi:MAG: PhzF family phenazine biosynthesis protein [Opitutaceae bacterium]